MTSVLVAEDDRATGKFIRLNLEDKDTRVIEAATGSDCLRLLQESVVDLLLLDLRLPDVDGWSILGHLRAIDSYSHLPVIVVSAEPPDRTLIRRFSLNDYVQKPFDVRELVLRVREAIGRGEEVKCAA